MIALLPGYWDSRIRGEKKRLINKTEFSHPPARLALAYRVGEIPASRRAD